MSKVIILQQVAHEGPGRIGPVLRDFGIPVELRRMHYGDEAPTDLDEVRALIVLSGPMRISDAGGETCPFLEKQLQTLQRMVEQDRPVLGIGFGAQLLAHAAGAKVLPNTRPGKAPDQPGEPTPEFGWGPIRLPFPGGTEPIVLGLMDGAVMFHWHFDTFDLPKLPPPPADPGKPGPPPPTGNALLSSTAVCRNQAFRFKNRLFAFQYHFEKTEADIEDMLVNASEEVLAAIGKDGIERARQETSRHYRRYARLGERILRNWVQFLKLYHPSAAMASVA